MDKPTPPKTREEVRADSDANSLQDESLFVTPKQSAIKEYQALLDEQTKKDLQRQIAKEVRQRHIENDPVSSLASLFRDGCERGALPRNLATSPVDFPPTAGESLTMPLLTRQGQQEAEEEKPKTGCAASVCKAFVNRLKGIGREPD
jgi:hypothetical protein